MNWLRNVLPKAGISNPKAFFAVLGFGAALTFSITYELLHLVVLAFAVTMGAAALVLEAVSRRANRRAAQISDAWPSVLESLESAASSGLSLLEAFRELSDSHNSVVAEEFALVVADLDSGASFDEALLRLRGRLGLPCTDLTVEILRQVVRSGGRGLTAALRRQAATAREQALLIGEIEAKQGWVLGTAKLAVASPWIVIALIAIRPENSASYASPTGLFITAAGLAASVLAFRLVSLMGRVDYERRVFA